MTKGTKCDDEPTGHQPSGRAKPRRRRTRLGGRRRARVLRYRKQRQTAKRIFERLRDEHGFTGGYTIVKDYVREHRRHRREMFVPLTHPPGHAQADFSEAWAVIAGVKQKVDFFAFDLPQSAASYVSGVRANQGRKRG